MRDELKELERVVLERRLTPAEGSYTNYLFDKGLDKILKKIGEECAETIIAAKGNVKEEVVGEVSDVIYHLVVMLAELNIPYQAVVDELEKRSQKIGNLKEMKKTDKNT